MVVSVDNKTLDLRCVSTETKPTHWPMNEDGTDNPNNPLIQKGSTIFEIDTSKAYMFNGTEWILI